MLNPSAAGRALPGVLLVLCAAATLLVSSASAIGVTFGQLANNLPSDEVVLQLIQTTSVRKIRIYGADPGVLTTFAGTGIDFVIGADNDQIQPMAANSTPSYALQWVQNNIVAYPNTSIVGVSLGNEVLSYDPELIPFLVPALQNLQAALVSLGLDQTVKISTSNSLGIVAKSFPPSYGEFHYLNGSIMGSLLDFLAQTGAPFMVNVYPYFAYTGNPGNISLDYCLFQPSAIPVYDNGSGLNYTNMFDAQLDAVYAAMSKVGYNNVTISVTETGWPSAGDPTEVGANVTNAQLFNANLVKHIESGVGTPAKPNVTVDTYIFALYNEDMKPGPSSERNFGLYNPDGTPIYDSGLTVSPDWLTYPPPPPSPALPPVITYVPPPTSLWSPPPPVLPPITYAPPPPSFWSPPPVATPPVADFPPPPWISDPPVVPPVVASSPPAPTLISSPPPPVSAVPPVTDPPPPPATAVPPVADPPPPPPAPVLGPLPSPVIFSPPPPDIAVPPATDAPPPVIVGSPPISSTPAPSSTPIVPGTPTVPEAPGPGLLTPSWCVAKPDADPGQLQIALDWACSTGGADCSLIQAGAACFSPNTLVAHASYAFDSYYQLNDRNYWNCYFSATAVITAVDPGYVGCTYP